MNPHSKAPQNSIPPKLAPAFRGLKISTQCIAMVLLLGARLSIADGVVSGVDFEVVVKRVDAARGEKIIYRDTVSPVLGVPAVGYWGMTSAELRITRIDSQAVSFTLHLSSARDAGSMLAREYRADYGLPIPIKELRGKNDWRYELTLTPLESFSQDTTGCGFSLSNSAEMTVHPTAVFHLTAPTGTLAERSLNALGERFEEAMRYYERLIAFHSSFKGQIIVLPCETPAVMWSKSEKVLVDPDRGTIWMQYAIDRNGFDHTAVNLLMLQRHEGYAPYPLQLALSRFDSMDEWRVVGRKKMGAGLPDVSQWYDNWTANDSQEMREAASAFFRFLILRSSIDSLRKFIAAADEFELSKQIASHYRQSFDSLVTSWYGYLDTVTFLPRQMVLFSDRAASGFLFEEARQLMEQSFTHAVSDKDSSFAIEKLMSLCFAQGDFAAASRYAFLGDSLSLAGGSYAFLAGDSATGASTFRKILEKNPGDNGARFGLANIAVNSGQVEKGIAFLRANIQNVNTPMAQPESRALLASSLPRRNGKRSPDTDSLLAAARSWYEQALNSEQSTPSMYVWYGMVLVAQGEYALGERALHSAALLEVRPFYRAMALIWLGKSADLQGDRETAKLYYSQVGTLNAGVYQKQEAENLMTRAFKF